MSPFSSKAQERFMWSQHPEIAKRWVKEGKGYVKNHVSKPKRRRRR